MLVRLVLAIALLAAALLLTASTFTMQHSRLRSSDARPARAGLCDLAHFAGEPACLALAAWRTEAR